jgi:hypothetical protein
MSRLFVASPGRERYAPADRARVEQLIRRSFLLAGGIETFATQATELLSFEEYQTLIEQEQRLLAYGNLLAAAQPLQLVEDAHSLAEKILQQLQGEKGGAK